MPEQALALARARGDSIGAYAALYNLANMAQVRGDQGEAARLFKEALVLSAQLGEKRNSAHGLEGLAWVATRRGNWGRAATLWGAAQMLLEGGEAARYANAPERSLDEGAMAAGRSHLGAEVFEAAWAKGMAMTLEQAVAYALEE